MMMRMRTHFVQTQERKSNSRGKRVRGQVLSKSGDAMKTAVEQIWNEFSTRLGQFIRARVADPATAEDILHDVFVKFQRSGSQRHTRINQSRHRMQIETAR